MTASTTSPTYGTAVIIGASIGGCSAAAVLAPHFERVVVLDRDTIPSEPKGRKGVPHGHQYHALSLGGLQAFESLFPGFKDQAVADGVPEVDLGAGWRVRTKFGWWPIHETGVEILQATRNYFEFLVRSSAKKHSNVEIVSDVRVTGLVASDGRVTGVTVNDANGDREISADFVVDTSGRGSGAPEWLEAAGFSRPVETTVNAKWGYATVYVRPPEGWDTGYQAIVEQPPIEGDAESRLRGGAMWAQEGGLVVLTATGCGGDYPPSDPESFREFLGTINIPDFQHAFDNFEVVGPIIGWRNTANRMRNFAAAEVRPDRFVAIGDATAAFNPIYGQGMAGAAFGANMLRDMLAERQGGDLAGFALEFQKSLQTDVLEPIWLVSTSADYGVPGVEVDGVPFTPGANPEAEFMARVMALTTEDKEVHQNMVLTSMMVQGAEWLAEPELQERVQKDWDRLGQLRAQPGPVPGRRAQPESVPTALSRLRAPEETS